MPQVNPGSLYRWPKCGITKSARRHFWSLAGALTVTSSTFAHCAAGMGGAAVHARGGLVTVTRSMFEHNAATGGRLPTVDSSATTFVGKVGRLLGRAKALGNAPGDHGGGALHLTSAAANSKLSDCVFRGNTAVPAGSGGAVYCAGGTLSISATAFVDNVAGVRGGAVFGMGAAVLTLTGSSFVRNSVDVGTGGAVCVHGSRLEASGLELGSGNFGFWSENILYTSNRIASEGAESERGVGFPRAEHAQCSCFDNVVSALISRPAVAPQSRFPRVCALSIRTSGTMNS